MSIFDDPKVRLFMIDVVRRCCLTISTWIEKEYKLKSREERELAKARFTDQAYSQNR